MDLLTELGLKHNTDKAYLHKFTEHYDNTFNLIRHEIKNVLEIGVQSGGSIAMWLEYFPNAIVTCIDITDYSDIYKNNPRVKFICFPQSDFKTDSMFDIIIDDGSHTMNDQQTTFTNLINNWSRYYILEDLHTSAMYAYGFNGSNSTIDFLKKLHEEKKISLKMVYTNSGESITSIIKRPEE